MTEKTEPFHLVFVDVETTGLNAREHEVISIAAIRVELPSWEVLDEMHCLVLPEHPEREADGAFAVNGYDPERWAREALTMPEARALFEPVAEGAGLSAHNRGFERAFLSEWYGGDERKGPWTHRGVCSQALCAGLVMAGLTRSNGLREACDVLGVELDHHEAMSDARASMEVARILLTHTVNSLDADRWFDALVA